MVRAVQEGSDCHSGQGEGRRACHKVHRTAWRLTRSRRGKPMGPAGPYLLQEPGGAGDGTRHRPEVVPRPGDVSQGRAGALAADVEALRSADYRGGPARGAHGRELTAYLPIQSMSANLKCTLKEKIHEEDTVTCYRHRVRARGLG